MGDSGSLAMHAAMGVVATAQVGHNPCVLVWEVTTCKLLARIAGFHQVFHPTRAAHLPHSWPRGRDTRRWEGGPLSLCRA